MPIEADVKQNLIKAIKAYQEPEKLRLVGLYKQLIDMYDEDNKYGQLINENTYNTHEKIRVLANRAIQIMKNQHQVVDEDLLEKDEFFSKEEQESEAFKQQSDQKPEIQNFWLHLLLKVHVLEHMISEKDKEIMAYLDHIEVFRNQENSNCRVEFTFKENEFFTNPKLIIESITDENDGTEIEKIKSEGINWKAGKNILISTVQKKVGNKKGKKKAVEKEQRNESFFWIFKDYNAEDFEADEEDDLADYDMEPTSDRALFDTACQFIDIMVNDFLVFFIPACYDVNVPNFEDHCHNDEEGQETEAKPQNCQQQ